MRISDWSSDVCSSDLVGRDQPAAVDRIVADRRELVRDRGERERAVGRRPQVLAVAETRHDAGEQAVGLSYQPRERICDEGQRRRIDGQRGGIARILHEHVRSEEHTSELQSLMRISYTVFCLKKK